MPHCDNPKCTVKEIPYRLMEKDLMGFDNNPLPKRFYVGVFCDRCAYEYRVSPIMNHKEAMEQVEAHTRRHEG